MSLSKDFSESCTGSGINQERWGEDFAKVPSRWGAICWGIFPLSTTEREAVSSLTTVHNGAVKREQLGAGWFFTVFSGYQIVYHSASQPGPGGLVQATASQPLGYRWATGGEQDARDGIGQGHQRQ